MRLWLHSPVPVRHSQKHCLYSASPPIFYTAYIYLPIYILVVIPPLHRGDGLLALLGAKGRQTFAFLVLFGEIITLVAFFAVNITLIAEESVRLILLYVL